MNIYHPYEVLADTPDCIHLKETDARERMRFLFYRIFPIFLLLLVWLIIQEVGTKIPNGWNYALVALALLTTGLLFFRSYITEIKITVEDVFLLQKTTGGTREITIDAHDIKGITLKRRKGQMQGAYFYLHTKNKKSYLILSIASVYTDEHQIKVIKENLEQLLKIKVS